ncbi:hypothetical protein OG311_38155 (plasmid) [Streptomyces sp. NBC_01343]|uniref:hypothetical protein n=1 Tax=Streptomyces sp. NBC_01343 TaxID=2903832 RepID=UPI002E0E9446|nr:hypothetical protein OG311_38155 [Streptomyces sp. NBC_01343]
MITYADTNCRDTKRGRPYRQELAAQLGVSVSTLDRTVFEGECAGLWRVKERTRKAATGQKINDSNVYYLFDAELWNGEWADPLRPGEAAADVAKARLEVRRAAKRAAGIKPKGGRKPMAAREGGGVTGDAMRNVTGDARGGITGDAHVYIPEVQSPTPEPQASPPVHPSVPLDDARESTDGRTVGRGGVIKDQKQSQQVTRQASAKAHASPTNNSAAASGRSPDGQLAKCGRVAHTPGVLLLSEIGAWHPEYLVTGQTLADQGLVVTGMLAEGWKPSSIRQVITGRPLPVPMTHTVGAVISARLRQAAAGPAPSPTASWASIPTQSSPAEGSTTAAADRTVYEAVARRTRHECPDCGRPAEAGEELCAEHLGWPRCEGTCGRRLRHGRTCEECALDAHHAAVEVEPAPDGTCPGIVGAPDPCGRPVVTLGFCFRCRTECENARKRADYDRSTATAVAPRRSSPVVTGIH